MPLEIRELIIRTQIVSEEKNKEESTHSNESNLDEKDIVEQCVKQVLKILERKMER